MNQLLAVFGCGVALLGCTSVESASINSADFATSGDAIAVIQASALGLTFLANTIEAVPSDLDVVVNRLLITEAKAMGASRIELKSASTTARQGIYRLPALIVGVPSSTAVGIAIK